MEGMHGIGSGCNSTGAETDISVGQKVVTLLQWIKEKTKGKGSELKDSKCKTIR